MNVHVRRVTTPLVFFDHELDNLNQHRDYSHLKFFTFVDSQDKIIRKQLYIPYDFNNKHRYGDNIMIMKKLVEKRYSQSTIDSCRADYRRRGLNQYEWHYATNDVMIDAETGEEIYEVNNKYAEEKHLYVYGDVVVETGSNSRNKVINRKGEILWEGYISYGNLNNTKDYLILNINHDYNTDLDTMIVIDKKSGTIVKTF